MEKFGERIHDGLEALEHALRIPPTGSRTPSCFERLGRFSFRFDKEASNQERHRYMTARSEGAVSAPSGTGILSTNSTQPRKKKIMQDIIDTAVGAGTFKTLATALTEAGLIATLKGPGPFTVFAPTDEAFAKVPKSDLDALLKDKKKLAAVLTYHVVPGKVMAADVGKLLDGTKVKTVEGREFKLGLKGGKVTVDNANVVRTDIEATNGVIHVLDSVIMPA